MAAGLFLLLCLMSAGMVRPLCAAPAPLAVTVQDLPQAVRVHIRANYPLPRHFVRTAGQGEDVSLRIAGHVARPQSVPVQSGSVRAVSVRADGGSVNVTVDRQATAGYRSCYRDNGRELVLEVDKVVPVAAAVRQPQPPLAALSVQPAVKVASFRLSPLPANLMVAEPSILPLPAGRTVMVASASTTRIVPPAAQAAASVRPLMTSLPGTWRVFGAESQQAKKVTLDFVHADIQDVLKALAIQSGVNILVAPSTEAKDVTVGLRDVTPDEALNKIVRVTGLAYGREGNTYVVCSREQIKEIFAAGSGGEIIFPPPAQEGSRAASGGAPLQVQVARTKRAPAADVVALVTKLIPGVKADILDAGLKTVALTGTADQLASAQIAIQALDGAYPEIGLVSLIQVVRTKNVSAADGVALVLKIWPGVKAEAVDAKAIAITGTREQVDAAAAAVGALDAATPASVDPKSVVAPAAQRQVQMETYILKHVSAAEAGRILQPLMKSGMLPDVFVTTAAAPAFPIVAGDSGAAGGATTYQQSGNDPGAALIDLLSGRSRGGAPGGAAAAPGQPGTPAPMQTGPATADATSPVIIPEGSLTNALLLIGEAPDLARVRQALGQIDLAPAQVMIDLKVTDVTQSASERLGVKWSWSNFGISELVPEDSGTTEVPGLQLGKFAHTPATFNAQLEALIATDKAHMLANPRLAVLDGRTANIHVGDTIRYLAARQTTLNGTTVTIGTADVGVVVQVTPRVGGDNVVTLDIRPKVNTITGYTQTGDGGQVPNTSERSVQTVVRLKDGETLAIGGLIRDEDIQAMEKIPGLSAVPLLGELFKFRSKVRKSSELLIFITPTIVPEAL